MRTPSSLTLLLLVLPLTAHAQTTHPKKDLVFAQVAAGGGYETILNVTNRGANTYSGVLSLYHLTSEAWNPLVNGTRIAGGKMSISIGKGTTATYTITQDGGTEAGFALLMANDMALDNSLEGTLTYYIRSSNGTLVDSVGVQPSTEIYFTTIPFDDFSKLALALANPNAVGATVKLSLFDEANTRISALDQSLASKQHMAKYLWQLFPSVQLARGRLEIQSDVSILGTALTDISGQSSSLPLLPGVKAYTFNVEALGQSGEVNVWFDGAFVHGYIRGLKSFGAPVSNPETVHLVGTFVDGVLQLHRTGRAGSGSDPMLSYFVVSSFSLSQTTVYASWTGWWLNSKSVAGSATAVWTAIN